MNSAFPSMTQVTVAIPATDRPACEDPYTRAHYTLMVALGARRRTASWFLFGLGLFLVAVGSLEAVLLSEHVDWTILGFGLAILLLSLRLLTRRVGSHTVSLLRNHAWREVPVDVVASAPPSPHWTPSVLRDRTGQLPGYLRLRWMVWSNQQVVLRTGRVWLCGPDQRGRALARVDGSCSLIRARVRAEVGKGQPPQRAMATGPRPADDPVLTWIQSNVRSTAPWLYLFMVIPTLGGAVWAYLSWRTDNLAMAVKVGAFTAFYAVSMLISIAQAKTKQRGLPNVFDLLREANHWTPLPMRLDGWTPTRRLATTGTIFGVVRTPDGGELPVRLASVSLSLLANIDASRTLWIAGTPRPGAVVLAGLPGYPLLGRAQFG